MDLGDASLVCSKRSLDAELDVSCLLEELYRRRVYHDVLDSPDGLDTLVIANWAKLSCVRLETSSLLLAVIIVLITSCLITPPCYELSR